MTETPTIASAPPLVLVRIVSWIQRSLVRLSRRLLPPPFAVLDMASNQWLSTSLQAVAKLRIADHLRDGPLHISQLAELTHVHEESLYRVLRALARHDVFKEKPQRTFRLTSLSKALLSDAPNSIYNMALLCGSPWARECWNHFEKSVQTGDPVFHELFGMDSWSYFEKHPEQGEIFHRSMVDLTRQIAGLVASAYDFSRFKTLIDLGGGSGELLAVILAKHPALQGVNLDLVQALHDTPTTMDFYGVSDRCEIVEGNIFESVPAGFDVYLMKNIVHEYSDEKLEKPLTYCREAMRPDSRLVLVECVVPEPTGPYLEFLDLLMLLSAEHGRERTREQFEHLLARYGFVLEEIKPTVSPMSVIVAKRK